MRLVSASRRVVRVVVLWAISAAVISEAFAGSLLVGDLIGGAIRRYDSSTGASLGVFASGGGMTSPYGLAFGPDGNLYVAEWDLGVLRFDGQTGAYLGVFIPGGADDLVFRPDGDLYVSRLGGLHTVDYYDSSGAWQRTVIAKRGLSLPTALSLYGDTLFVTYTSSYVGELYQYNTTSGAFSAVYTNFSGNGPRRARFGPDGNLYVPDWGTYHVAKFDGATLAYQGNLVDDSAHYYPIAVDFGPDGTMYVLDDSGSNASISRYNLATGAWLGYLVAPGSGGLSRACSFVFVPEQRPRLQVTDAQRVSGSEVLHLAWKTCPTLYVLERAGTVTGTWNTVSSLCVTNGDVISTAVTNPSSAQFYRLRAN